MKNIAVNMRFPAEEKKMLEKEAQKWGVSFSELVREGAKLLAGFTPEVRNYVRRWAAALDIPEHVFVQNVLIKRWAEEAAETEVYGHPVRVLDEFHKEIMKTGESVPVTGERLFEQLKSSFKKRLDVETLESLVRRRIAGVRDEELDRKIEELCELYREDRESNETGQTGD